MEAGTAVGKIVIVTGEIGRPESHR
jgi:hypothetical protein